MGSELLVSQTVADVLNRNRQQGWKVERGGQLFVDPANPAGLLLTLATPPHRADRAGWSWLQLDEGRCQQEIKNANAQGLRLVGYWHTHPQTTPAISSADIKTFSKFAARYCMDLPHPIAVIVGKSERAEGIKAWSVRDGKFVEAIWVSWPGPSY